MSIPKLIFSLLAVGALALVGANAVQAQATLEGEVVVIDSINEEILIQTDEGEILTIIPPEDFDWSSIAIGDQLNIEGEFADEFFVATEVSVSADSNVAFDSDKSGYYCENPDDHHPALDKLAQVYDWDYAELLEWFCEGRFGVGEIKHALSTSQQLDGELHPAEILQMKRDLGGWGRVWQELGLKGGGNGNGRGGD